jgi:polysaccharide lyase-like protein
MRSSRIFRVGWRVLLVLTLAAVPAFAAETVVDIVQGEDMSKVSGKRVDPVTVFYSDGRVEKNVRLERRATKLVVKADSGPQCGTEWPHMVVEVDNVPVLSTTIQESGYTSAPVNVPAGTHTVAVSYDNDYYEPADAFTSTPRKPLTCDRNLTLDAIGLLADENTDPAPAPPPSPTPTPEPSPTPPPSPSPSPPPGPSPPPAPSPSPSPTPPPVNESDILWTGDAEKPWDDSLANKRWPDNNEWVDYSCQDRSRFSQVSDRVAQGRRAYRIEVHDGDDSYGERCELDNGNTSASRLHYQMLFHDGQEAWLAFQTYLPLDFSFAAAGAPVSFPNDGGLIMQIKQLGSCGTPALGIVSSRTVFALRNSAAAHCESGPMQSLWKVPMVLGHWVKWLQHIRFSTDPRIGFISTWYDPDGLGLRPIIPTLDFGHRVVANRIYTHTQKSPTGHPDPACPADDVCSHGRIGIYRDPDVSGTSVIYHDGWTVAKTRAAAVGNAFAP